MFKYFALGLNYFFIVCYYAATHTFNLTILLVLLPPIFHTLAFLVKPHCYQSHCKPSHLPTNTIVNHSHSKTVEPSTPKQLNSPLLEVSSPSPSSFSLSEDKGQNQQDIRRMKNKKNKQTPPEHEYQPCVQCGLIKWVRMHHCYYCNVCVHKYDHHCVLLGICIGEANQKYYLPFLWAFLCSSALQAYDYYGLIGNYLWVDQRGYEHTEWAYSGMSLAIIFFLISTVIVGYLAVYHTYLGLHNDTTYQMRKRPDIYYFKGIITDHPFDKGIINNLKMLMATSPSNPIQWERPQKPIIRGLHDFYQDKNIFDQRQHDELPEFPKPQSKFNF